jgi:hypothetical protein
MQNKIDEKKLRDTNFNFGFLDDGHSPSKKSMVDKPDGDKVINDEDAKKKMQEELVLYMGSPIYKKICYKLCLRNRTLLDRSDVTNKIIKDDSLQI